MNSKRANSILGAILVLSTMPLIAGEPSWKQHTINATSEFEAAGVFDVDNDGKLDIVSVHRGIADPTGSRFTSATSSEWAATTTISPPCRLMSTVTATWIS